MHSEPNLCLFDRNALEAERREAIDRLHHATCIYTACAVVSDLIDRLRWPAVGGKFLDPAAGDGQMVGHALHKLLEQGDISDDQILSRIEAWEIHPHACHQTRARLANTLIEAGRTRENATAMAEMMVHNKDFLTQGPTDQRFSTIATNPPYIRRLKIPSLLREEYDIHVPRYAVQDLQHGFIDRLAKMLCPNGQIGIISADRWLYASSARALRGQLGATLTVRHLRKLEASTTFYHPKSRRSGTPPRVHPVEVILGHGKGRALSEAPLYPASSDTCYGQHPILGDLATVKISPWLGPLGIFLINAGQAREAGIDPSYLVPAVDVNDIKEGVIGCPKLFAIRTEPKVRPDEATINHLSKEMGRMPMSARRKTPWMPPESFHTMDLSKPALMVPRIAKTPKSVLLPAHVLNHNHHLKIAPHNQDHIGLIAKALEGPVAKRWIEEHAAPLEGGYFALSAPLLRRLPIETLALVAN